ncbi:Predicted PurR-regulated permease PerM [Chitinophaga jiangningensis]|uniref:Predicted PurR-regulated permease PerM n=1 Tax=Chitinophaga jiangningensis TaxID=1419482 RepID=A0A1M7EMK1_9BACT|nr:AI-2E family transporter [Chitinophaga jiangningensis]SHL93015.1 Predicted PurR-regulated permease PerM [Chitinophaga jiangningensis]
MSYIDNGRLKQIGFLLLILFLAILLFTKLFTYFPGFLGAVTFYVLCRNWMIRLTEKRKWNKSLAATLLMLLTFLIILLPVGALINMLSAKIAYAVNNSAELITQAKTLNNKLSQEIGFTLITDARLQKFSETATSFLPGFLGATFNTLTTIAILYFILYFMLVNLRSMELAIYEYIPLKDENVELLGREFNKLVIANAVGIPLIAVIQGIVSLGGYLIFGVPQPFFWFVVTCFTAMLPVIGAAAVYVPLGVYLLAAGNTFQGLAVLIYGFAVVGTSDNISRFLLAKRIADVHPLITIFGVLIGVNLFGFIGLIFGPLLISMFILLLQIYSNEFLIKKRSAPAGSSGHKKVTVRNKTDK